MLWPVRILAARGVMAAARSVKAVGCRHVKAKFIIAKLIIAKGVRHVVAKLIIAGSCGAGFVGSCCAKLIIAGFVGSICNLIVGVVVVVGDRERIRLVMLIFGRRRIGRTPRTCCHWVVRGAPRVTPARLCRGTLRRRRQGPRGRQLTFDAMAGGRRLSDPPA